MDLCDGSLPSAASARTPLAALEVPDLRNETARAYTQDHLDWLPVPEDMVVVLA
jgi:hypothetical protein